MFFSKNPKLNMEKLLVFGALGLYLMKHIRLKKNGELPNEPDLLLKIDKKKLFDNASKIFKINTAQRTLLEGMYERLLENKDEIT